jgi:hypothetical protein
MDYGVLLTENREFVASAAWMFDTDIVPLSRLRLQWDPRPTSLGYERATKPTYLPCRSERVRAHFTLFVSSARSAVAIGNTKRRCSPVNRANPCFS